MKVVYHRYDFKGHFIRAVSTEAKPLYSVFYTDTALLKVMKEDYTNERWLPVNWDIA